MKTLLVYGTNSGSTLVASELVRDVLSSRGHDVILKRANLVEPDELKTYDLVVLGSCTWDGFNAKRQQHLEGQLQQHMQELRDKLVEQKIILPGHRFAVFGLGDTSYKVFAGAADRLVELVNDVGGELIGEALKIDNYFLRQDENELKLRDWSTKIADASQANGRA